ncbi:hypothetical protein CN272_25975 [Bacillus anthracis]|nr:hypothetical protein CN272_25975 [Bacillus anthracis]PFD83873.1 hypothetical protein CN275_27135 [Bacillus anthracis]PFT26845.1 hypothetical protein COK52_05235 [Bacillus thuringiensis]
MLILILKYILIKNYTTVANRTPLNKTIYCTEVFRNQKMCKFGDGIEGNERGKNKNNYLFLS